MPPKKAPKKAKRKVAIRKAKGKGLKEIAGKVSDTIEKVKNFLLFPPNRLPPSSRKVFDKYKDLTIKSMDVRRAPITSKYTQFANWLTNGKFDENLKKLGYDKVFHLYLVLTMSDGTKLLLEKNERILLKEEDPPKGPDVETKNVPMHGHPTLEEFMEKARSQVGNDQFFRYSANANNCQRFVLDLLEANLMVSESIETFVKQDAKAIFSALPSWATRVAQFGSDVAAKVDELVQGGKKRRSKAKPKVKPKAKPKKKS